MKKKINKSFKTFGGCFLKKTKTPWLKLFFLVLIINIIYTIILSKIIIKEKIIIPNLYSIFQGLIYLYEKTEHAKIDRFFDVSLLIFFGGVFFINIPLLIFSYYKVGREYTKRTCLVVFNFIIIGIIFATRPVQKLLDQIDLGGSADDLSQRIKDVRYYLIILIIGIFGGVFTSIIWKNQMGPGGLDVVYVFLAMRSRVKIELISLPIRFVAINITIIIMTLIGTDNINPQTHFFLIVASLWYGYVILFTANKIYPKFMLFSFWIITNKGTDLISELRKNSKRGGFIFPIFTMYNNEDKQIISSSVTYLELDHTIKIVQKIDKKAFFIINPIKKIEGSFIFRN